MLLFDGIKTHLTGNSDREKHIQAT